MMMMAATVTPVVLKVRERERDRKKSLFLSVPIHPLVLFIQFFWPCVGWKGKKKKKKKWCADSFMAVGECTRRRRRMESLVLFFFFLFYCVPTTLLVPPPPSFFRYFMARWMISTKRRSREEDGLVSFFSIFPLLYTCECARKNSSHSLFFYSPDEKIGLKWHWSDFFFFFPIWKQWRNF